MRNIFFKWAAGTMVILFLAACAAMPKEDPKADAGIAETEQTQDSSYYYFTEAQLAKKKGNLDRSIVLLKNAIELDPESVYLKKELTGLFLLQKDEHNALRLVEEILQNHPDDTDALITLGKIKQSQKKLDEAKEAYRRVLVKAPDKQNIHLLLGSIYMQENNLSAALELYREVVEKFPDSYVGYFYVGRIEAKQGNLAAAEKAFLKTLELNSNLEEPRFELIKLYDAQGNTARVVDLYQEILSISPNHVRAAMGFGLFYHRQGKTALAASIFFQLGKRSLTDSNVIRHLVQEYLDDKKYDEAIVILTGMLKGAPGSSDIHYVAGVAYDGKEDKSRAVDNFSKVSPDSKFYLSAAVQLAFLAQDMGNIEKGIDHLTALIEKFPQNTDLYLYLGSFYEEIEQFAKAIGAFQRGIELEPENAKAYFRLGVVYDKGGDKKSSIGAMKKVIDLDPKNANALNYLGYTYADLGQNLEEAERLIRRALELKPEDGYITDSLGWVFYKQGYYEIALKYLKKAASIVPDDPVILEHLGDTFLKINDGKQALEYYQRSLIKQKKDKERNVIQKKIEELTGKGF